MDSNAASKEFASPDNFGMVELKMPTVAESRPVKSRSPRRTIGFVTASSIVIANISGTGIVTSLGFQLAHILSAFSGSARRCFYHLWLFGWYRFFIFGIFRLAVRFRISGLS